MPKRHRLPVDEEGAAVRRGDVSDDNPTLGEGGGPGAPPPPPVWTPPPPPPPSPPPSVPVSELEQAIADYRAHLPGGDPPAYPALDDPFEDA